MLDCFSNSKSRCTALQDSLAGPVALRIDCTNRAHLTARSVTDWWACSSVGSSKYSLSSLGERTLVSASLLCREWYLPVSHLCRSGPPRSLLPAVWQSSPLSTPQLPSGSSGTNSTSCHLLAESTSAILPWPCPSPQICASSSCLSPVVLSSV